MVASAAGEEKPEVKQLTLIIKSQNSGDLAFKVKPHTKFRRIATAWATNAGVQLTTARFINESGERIDLDKPVSESELGFELNEDGEDVAYVDAFLEQLGGGC